MLDIGAGNGMVGEQLVDMGAEQVGGVDIIEEAAQALERDRPGIYKDYDVADLTNLPPMVERSPVGWPSISKRILCARRTPRVFAG